jgi:hypothetical protein
MRSRLAACLSLSCLYLCCLGHAGTIPTLDEILPRVQEHVREFEFSLPDFMCNERITSGKAIGSKINGQTIINSVFRGTQNKDELGRPFTESREIKTINGKPAPKDQPLKVPFFFGGGFSSILDATFGEDNIPYHNYKVIGVEKVDGKAALVIKFSTKDGQQKVHFEFLGNTFVSKDIGKAWIDQESMHVARLERRYLNLPPPYGVLAITVDYGPVAFNGKTFWMPRMVRVEETQINSRHPVSAQYIAEYSNYQKFGVSTKMKY